MIFFFCLGFIIVHTATSASISATTTAPGCTLTALNKNKVKFWPIFTMNYQFIYAPKGLEVISIPTGKSVEISCPGGTFKGLPNKETNIATCVSGSKYKINGVTYDLVKTNFYCTVMPKNDARLTAELCENKGKGAKVGFSLPGSKYVQQIRFCFDPTTQLAFYANYTVSGSIGKRDEDSARPFFQPDTFYSLGNEKIDNLYTQNKQRATINKLLGYPIDDKSIIRPNTDYYLSRGHLAAKQEFVYGSQQNATFHYINVAPQWQIFNGGNWNILESKVTDYAYKHSKDLEIFTGTFNVTTLPHKNGTRVPLYLYVNGKQNALPVPELYWKAVYEPTSKKAAVIFGVNNPYYNNEAEIKAAKSILCKDVLPKLTSWVSFTDPHDLKKGYMYACEFSKAKLAISYLPAWQVTGLLI